MNCRITRRWSGRGGDILHLRSSVARAPPRPLNGLTLFGLEAFLNSIAQIKTVPTNGPQGPTTAMMIALNVDDVASAEGFVHDVGEQFKVHRTVAPPNTSMLLISIVGPLAAETFAKHWAGLIRTDDVIRAYMSLMTVADAVQGTKTGQQLSQASLKLPGDTQTKKPWWKIW